MENNGYIKLYRKLLDNPVICKDSDHFSIWIYLLLNATHEKYDVMFNNQRTTLSSGQLITSRKSISQDLHIVESKVERVLKLLKSEHQIEQQTTSKNRLITVLKWKDYQASEQHFEQRVNNKWTTSEQQVDTNKNVKNVKNVKNEEYIEQKSSRFVAPTLDQVSEYVKEIKSQVDPQRFIDFYESKGWMVGRNKMKDWKAAVRTWQKSSFTKNRIEIVSDYPINEVNISDNEADEIKRSLKSLGGN